jgi:hypothetical protein
LKGCLDGFFYLIIASNALINIKDAIYKITPDFNNSGIRSKAHSRASAALFLEPLSTLETVC